MEDQAHEVYVTKELLLKGAKHIEEVTTSIGIVRVRPLTEGEKARIESLTVKGIKAKGKQNQMTAMDVEMDMEVLIQNDWEVRFHLLAAGLSVDPQKPFTLPEVKSMALPKEISNQLLEAIRKISGLPSAEEILRRFRERQGRTSLSVVGP